MDASEPMSATPYPSVVVTQYDGEEGTQDCTAIRPEEEERRKRLVRFLISPSQESLSDLGSVESNKIDPNGDVKHPHMSMNSLRAKMRVHAAEPENQERYRRTREVDVLASILDSVEADYRCITTAYS